mgnify:CR=1 FL=1
MSFESLGLIEPLLKAVAETGYTTPTPIPAQAPPAATPGGALLAHAAGGQHQVVPVLRKVPGQGQTDA